MSKKKFSFKEETCQLFLIQNVPWLSNLVVYVIETTFQKFTIKEQKEYNLSHCLYLMLKDQK